MIATGNSEPQSKRLFWVVCFVGFLLGLDNGGLQFALLKIANEFSMNEAAMGSLMTFQFGGLTLAALAAGFISGRIGKKRIAVISAALFTVSTFVCYLGISRMAVSIGVMGCGCAFGALEVAVCSALSDAYGHKAGRYLLIMQGLLGIGSVACPLMADFMMRKLGTDWNELFLVCAVLFATAFLLIVRTPFNRNFVEASEGEAGGRKLNIRDVVLIGMLGSALIYGCLEAGIGSFIDTFFATIVCDASRSALTLSLFWAAIGVSRLIAGMLYQLRKVIIVLAFVCGGALYFLLSTLHLAMPSMIVTISIGMLIGPVLPALVSLANERFPQQTGLMTSFVNAASGVGSSVGPLAVGIIAEMSGLSFSFVMLGGLSLLAATIFVTTMIKRI